MVTHADLGPVSEKPWNDIVVDARGNAYVNNIGFDFPDEEPAPGFVVLVTLEEAPRAWSPTTSHSPTAWPSPRTVPR